MVKTLPLRKVSLTTIVTVLTVVAVSSTVFSTATAAPVAFGQRIVNDSEQAVIAATTYGIDMNDTTTDRHTSSLRITQNPENGLDAECVGDLRCETLDNNTLTATTNTGQNTTTNNSMMITSALDALNQSLAQSVNQSSIPLPLPFGDNGFDDMLNNEFDIFNEEEEDLDSKLDEWIDRMLNGTLGEMRAPLQTSPDLRSVSV
jgi:hypothetical protein